LLVFESALSSACKVLCQQAFKTLSHMASYEARPQYTPLLWVPATSLSAHASSSTGSLQGAESIHKQVPCNTFCSCG
jgi:hypothetical protein